MFQCILFVFCFHNQNRCLNGLKTYFVKFRSEIGGEPFKFQFSLQSNMLIKKLVNSRVFDRNCDRSRKKQAYFWRILTEFGQNYVFLTENFDRIPSKFSVKIFPSLICGWFLLHTFDRKIGQKSVKPRILTDFFGQKIGQTVFWPTFRSKNRSNFMFDRLSVGQKIGQNFLTDRSK